MIKELYSLAMAVVTHLENVLNIAHTYSLMDVSNNAIVHVETIDKREVQLKSPNMEREGLSRALKYLEGKISVAEVTTDSSTSVTSLMG